MTSSQPATWIEIVKLIISAATPIAVAVIGVLLLRRIEGVKAVIAAQSEFQRRWSEEFFGCCQGFMQALERDLALLTFLSGLKPGNEKLRTEVEDEIVRLHPKLSEFELRIRRSVVFAPVSGAAVTKAAGACLSLTGKLIASTGGNVDEIIARLNEFNIASRKAHAEMLGLDAAEHNVAPDDRPRTAARN